MHELALNTELKRKAYHIVSKYHSGQFYGDIPYTDHLKQVVQVLIDCGYRNDDIIIPSGFLHDIMECCDFSYSDLKKEFNKNIAETVYCMTDEIGRDRTEKKEKTYPKLSSNPDSIIVKLADRIANIEYGLKNDGEKLDMYVGEHKKFKWMLYKPGHADALWTRLENLFPLIT